MRLLLVVLLLLLVIHITLAIRWLSLSKIPPDQAWNQTRQCPSSKAVRKKYGLVGYQVKFCRRLTDIMPVMMRAARGTNYVCQKLFADRRWNCSSIEFAPNLKPDLRKGTREQAYVYALSSAAVMHQVAKSCVTGEIPYCPCGATPTHVESGFKWKGCSDNVVYGKRVSIEFTDAAWSKKKSRRLNRKVSRLPHGLLADMSQVSLHEFMKGSDDLTPRAKMNQHNNNVGREVTSQSLETKCKCHGVSSSCSLKTCWKVLPALSLIGEKLRDRYARATEVRATNIGPSDDTSPVMSSPRQRLQHYAGNNNRMSSLNFNNNNKNNKNNDDDDDDDEDDNDDDLDFVNSDDARNHRNADVNFEDASPGGKRGEQRKKLERLASINNDFEPVALVGAVGATDLVYIRKSPDYCTFDARVGSMGTHSRECNATSDGYGSCDSMCCGRGFHSIDIEEEKNCHCKYVHCCYVKCQTCRQRYTKNFCK